METLHGMSKDLHGRKMDGWLALSPLAVFLVVYLVSSILANDFYSIPIASAFLIASCYAIAITKGDKGIEERISVFSKGAGDRNVLLMIWIFVLAGAFAGTAKEIGAIEATVDLTLKVLPGNLLYAGLFIASCFISMSIGTSVGTIVALVPITAGLAAETGASPGFMAAIVTGGAFFGDNLSFISDTTIASTRTQGCSMQDKFKVNIMETTAAVQPIQWYRLIPYILIIILAVSGINVVLTLAVGIGVNAVIGFIDGTLTWTGWLEAIGDGIGSMGELIIVTMLAGGMLEIIRHNGGIDFIINLMTRHIKGKRGAELSIAALVSLANLCTANNTIAIITTGSMAKDISSRYGLDPRKSASILDTFSCVVQGLLPYGAQLLMASGLAAVSTMDIIPYLYYPVALGIISIFAILIRYPRKYS